MRCRRCNAYMKEGQLLCSICGTPVGLKTLQSNEQTDSRDSYNQTGRLQKLLRSRFLLFLSVLLVVLLIGGVVCFFVIHNRTERESVSIASANNIKQEEVDNDSSSVKIKSEIEEPITDNVEQELFDINHDANADYSNPQVTDYSQYRRYESGIEKFNFSYPDSLYSEVAIQENLDGLYGTILKQIDMTASDGSFASFSISKNEITGLEDWTVQGMTDYVFSKECMNLYTPNILVNGISMNCDHGTIIMTGYVDASEDADYKYLLCRIEPEYIYHMMYSYPKPKDVEDDIYKGYFMDTMYRLCDYSGATVEPSTFVEYKEKHIDQFSLSKKQEKILRGLVRYIVEYQDVKNPRMISTMQMQYDKSILELYRLCVFDANQYKNSNYAYFIQQNDEISACYVDEVSSAELKALRANACGAKKVCPGALDHAKSFCRELLNVQLNLEDVRKDSRELDFGEGALLAYNAEYDELIYAHGPTEVGGLDGPTEFVYNDELQCYVFSFGPTYDISPAGESWQEHCDNCEAGNGIYRLRIVPYMNNSLGFKLLGLERAE